MPAKHISCKDVEYYLLLNQKSVGDIDLINQHISECQSCQKYKQVIGRLEHSMKYENDSELRADPAVYQGLLIGMQNKRLKRGQNFNHLLSIVNRVLQYRIPLYQTIAAAFLAAIIFIASSTISLPFSDRSRDYVNNININTFIVGRFNVLDSLQIINGQKLGISASEDTILTKLFFKSF